MEPVLMRALIFFIQTVFDFFIYMFVLRFLFQLTRCDYYNPVIELIVKFTNPLVKPMRILIPTLYSIDTAALITALALAIIENSLFLWLASMSLNVIGLLLWSAGIVLGVIVNVYFFAIIIQALMSWFVSHPTPIFSLLHTLNEPLLGRVRRALPGMAGLDISPIIALVGLQLINIILVAPITQVGMGML